MQFRDRGNFEMALNYLNKALTTRQKTNDKKGIAFCLNNIGLIYYDLGQDEKALETLNKALSIREELNDKKGVSVTLSHISTILFKQKKYNLAFSYSKRVFEIGNEMGLVETISKSAAQLYKIYKVQNDFENAFKMFELHIKMHDSIHNQETQKATVKTQLKYEYEKQAAADSVKNAEAQKVKDAELQAQSASLKQEKTQRYALYGGLVLVAGFLIFVINRFRITNKQKKIIEEQKSQVDAAFEKLHEKNKEVMDSIHYANRIQRALITSEKYIERKLKQLQ
jgi:tetratricopeptide (TPR) repeat protein